MTAYPAGMPTVTVNDVELYYERHGAGEPLLLIMGMSGNLMLIRVF